MGTVLAEIFAHYSGSEAQTAAQHRSLWQLAGEAHEWKVKWHAQTPGEIRAAFPTPEAFLAPLRAIQAEAEAHVQQTLGQNLGQNPAVQDLFAGSSVAARKAMRRVIAHAAGLAQDMCVAVCFAPLSLHHWEAVGHMVHDKAWFAHHSTSIRYLAPPKARI